MMDFIDREQTYQTLTEYYHHKSDMQHKALREALSRIPSATLVIDEWCTDCKEYDHEKSCCPRFNRVIARTMQDIRPKGKWIEHDDELGLTYECSVCHIEGMLHSNFCPNCGAEMEVE